MPNAMARGLTTTQSGLAGFVLSETENFYYQEYIQQLVGLAARREYTLMLYQVAAAGDFIDVIPKNLQYRLDGCISDCRCACVR
jgi:DNA-binding LacI/PurR family transcriptional regulator